VLVTALDTSDDALLRLLQALRERDYAFVTPTPATHARVVARPEKRRAQTLRDVFGWSRPFEPAVVGPQLVELMQAGGVLEQTAEGLVSAVRVSALDDRLLLHSAYPTDAADAVFFGPDSYRFAAFIQAELAPAPGGVIVDVGAGTGAGGLVAAARRPDARLVLTDVNPKALRLARINAAFAGVDAECRETSGLDGVDGDLDVVIANPPYMMDEGARAYRDGGALHGGALSLAWARAAARRLRPGGRLLLYTGSAIVEGRDHLREAIGGALAAEGLQWSWRELDPDVFGEELERPAYADVERIAAVGLTALRP
jgi:methylase of polypeptide subunit release factors